MDEVWVLVSVGGYEGFGEPGDCAFEDNRRLFFQSEKEAVTFAESLSDLDRWQNLQPFRLTRFVAP